MRVLVLFSVASLLPAISWASFNAGTVYEIRSTGSDTNGGGYASVLGGTDMSQYDNKNAAGCSSCQSSTANLSTTDLVTNNTITVTSATANFTSALIGNVVYIAGGTGSITGTWRQVLSVTNSTTIVLDNGSLTTGTGVTINIGGAYASPAIFCKNEVAGNFGFLRNTGAIYSVTTASPQVAHGTCGGAASSNLIGYTTNRTVGNTDTPYPTIQYNVASVTWGTAVEIYENIIFDCNNQTTSKFITQGDLIHGVVENCTAASSPYFFFDVYATGNSATVMSAGQCYYCTFHANTATPFVNGTCVYCISDNNTGASTDGFSCISNPGCRFINTVAASNGRHGYNANNNASSQEAFFANAIADSNVGTGFYLGAQGPFVMRYIGAFAARNNGTDVTTGQGTITQNQITLSASPFVSGSNFSLNNLAGAGANLSGTGYAPTLSNGSTQAYPNIGASEHPTSGLQTVTIGTPTMQ